MGGKLSDRAVRNWIVKRNGVRLPQDRLNSGLVTLFLVLPIGTLIYAWTLEEGVGGMPVPIIAAFFAAVGLLGSFNGLNTYSAGKTEAKFPTASTTLLTNLQRSCRTSAPRSSVESTSSSTSSRLELRRLLTH